MTGEWANSDKEPSDEREEEAPGRVEQASTILDPRIADLWAALWADGVEEVPLDAVGGMMRIAYLTGYQDCLTEPSRGALFRTLGLPVPARVRPGPSGRRPSR